MEGKHAGDIKSFGPLTLASVWGAGHMVKYSLAIGIDKQLISNFHRRRMISPRKFFRWCQGGWIDFVFNKLHGLSVKDKRRLVKHVNVCFVSSNYADIRN